VKSFLPKFFILLLNLSFVFVLSHCSSTNETLLEEARFALDSCNPSKPAETLASCQDALTKATAIINDSSLSANDPVKIEAGILASSANLGIAGIDFLEFAGKLSGLVDNQTKEGEGFQQFLTLIGDVETTNKQAISVDSLRSAVTSLQSVLPDQTSDTDLKKRALFQLGVTQSLETYVRPLKLIGISSINKTAATIDPSSISDTDATTLRKSLITSDDNVKAGGTTDANTLSAMREGFCLCETNAAGGYTGACLRDLLRCQIKTNTEGTEQDYNGNGIFGVTGGDRTADCAVLKTSSAAVTTCKKNDIK